MLTLTTENLISLVLLPLLGVVVWFVKSAFHKMDTMRDEWADYKTHVAQTYLPKTEADIRFDKLDARLDKLDIKNDKLDSKIDKVLAMLAGNRRSTDKAE